MEPWWFLLPWLTLGIPEFTQVRHPMAIISRPLSLEMSLSIRVQIGSGRGSWFQATDLACRAKCPVSSPSVHALPAGRTVHRWRGAVEISTQAWVTSSRPRNQAYHLFPEVLTGFQKIILSVLIGFQTHYLINLDVSTNILVIVWERTLSLVSFSLLSNSILNGLKKTIRLILLVFLSYNYLAYWDLHMGWGCFAFWSFIFIWYLSTSHPRLSDTFLHLSTLWILIDTLLFCTKVKDSPTYHSGISANTALMGLELIIFKYISHSSTVNLFYMPIKRCDVMEYKVIQKLFMHYFLFICITIFPCFIFA